MVVLRSQIAGLLLVVPSLGGILTFGGGSVRVPRFERGADGVLHRAMVTAADGTRSPAFIERNKFANAQNLAQLAKDTCFTAIMAVGMSIVIIGGGIDLSVGSSYALASVVGAMVLRHYGPEGAGGSGLEGVVLGGLACLGVAALAGLLNGALIVGLRVHLFVITLGAMAILRGMAFVVVLNGQSVGGFPPLLRTVVRFEVGDGLGLVPLAAMLAVLAGGGLFLSRLAAGRRVYAVGGNETAARFSGIGVERVKLGMYLLCGLTAGIAALVSLGYYGAATSGDGQGYELTVIAAAVVGGASLSGGRGSAGGAILGALVIQMISSGIVILGIDQNYSQIIIGAVVIAAVAVDTLSSWLVRPARPDGGGFSPFAPYEKIIPLGVLAVFLAAPLSAQAPRTITFGFIGKSNSNPVFPHCADPGAEDAARELGAKYHVTIKIDSRTPNEEDAQKQAEAIEQLVLAGVDGIAVSCSDANKVTGAINAAVDAGVPVATYDSDAPDSKRFVTYSIDSVGCGERVMDELAKLMNGKGTVAILAGSPNAPNLQLRTKGAKLAAAKYPGITVKGVYYHRETPQEAAARIEQVMEANPDITGWALIGGWPLFTEHALKWEPGTVKCVSMDALPAELAYVRSGHVPVLLHENFYQWGHRIVELLVDKVVLNKNPATVKQIEPLTRVTKDNVEDFAKAAEKWSGR